MELGKRISYAAREAGLTQVELAKRIDIDRVSVNRIIHGRARPSLITLQKIARAVGKSLEYFDEDFDPFAEKTTQVPAGFRRLPLFATVPAGTKRWIPDDVFEWIDIPATFVGKHKRIFLIKADGDSMEGAGILDGDLVAVACDKEISNGCIVVARIDDEAVIRRFRKLKDKIRLEPANPKYASEEYDSKSQVDIKGVVVWSGRKHS